MDDWITHHKLPLGAWLSSERDQDITGGVSGFAADCDVAGGPWNT